ncbi:short-chain dehydrogenase [Niabella ginsenosidivorans]|uniref:Short-chain dehydrogenase n=1 Tax=Niabella ginsenosidivorans TaxID=1176587 RepID=A0A1A9HZ44_9BACT|nr:SDR family NAD(P)-dependent oxidoreductase [Niabella ginsenosidivorans]ANH80677.1 short-chain dehydrogenase [Niabella ginsenosidivorans]
MNKRYTLITGAGSGLGSALAFSCAQRGMNLILITLPGTSIGKMAAALERVFDITVHYLEFDLTNTASFDESVEKIRSMEVDFLINNAGMGGTASILNCSSEHIDKIIQLNIRCTALLTQKLLPQLLRHKKSYLLNIASMAAFSPIAYKTVYPASKAFISSFSLGLREELQEQGLSVSVAYPGPIMTNSNTSQRILLHGFKGRMGLFSTQDLAEKLIRQTLEGKAIIIPGVWNRVNQRLMGLIPPTLKVRLISGAVKQELKIAR